MVWIGALQGLSISSDRSARPAWPRWCAVTAALVGFFGFVILRVTAPQMTPLFTDLTPGGLRLHHQGARAPGHPLRAAQRWRDRPGAEGQGDAPAHEARRRRPAQGRRRRLRDLRQVGRARRHQLRAEHQSSARAGRRTRPHHPGASTACRPRACIWCCPSARCSRAKAPKPSASIVLRVRGQLDAQQVRAIRHLVASAVNGLKPQRVSIVDETGQLAGRWRGDGAPTQRQRRRAATRGFEQRLRDQVEGIVSSVVGPGRARVQLTADFDFNG